MQQRNTPRFLFVTHDVSLFHPNISKTNCMINILIFFFYFFTIWMRVRTLSLPHLNWIESPWWIAHSSLFVRWWRACALRNMNEWMADYIVTKSLETTISSYYTLKSNFSPCSIECRSFNAKKQSTTNLFRSPDSIVISHVFHQNFRDVL